MSNVKLCLSESEGKARVLFNGMPVCADTTPDHARSILQHHVDGYKRRRVAVTVTHWNGDTGVETEVAA